MERIRKITPKGVLALFDTTIKEHAPGELFRIVGIVKSTEAVETNYGTSTKLKGTFKVIKEGREFTSGSAFLPDIVTEIVEEGLAANSDEPLEFGFIINKNLNEASSTGYDFSCSPLLAPTVADPLERLTKLAISGPECEDE